MDNSCLVLEGGGLRGAFTAGVLEFLLENKIHFGHIVGVSAGACVGASYVSKQFGRNRKVNVELPSDKRYMGFRHLVAKGSYFNMDFIFNQIPNRLAPFDESAFFQNPARFDIVATSFESGEPVIFSKEIQAEIGLSKALVASSSIPLISKPVNINEKFYFDGGVADSIPVRYALTQNEKAVVILTRPRGYRKEKLKNEFLFKMAFQEHPEFLKAILARSENYNQSLEYCEQMEQEGKVLILAPSADYSVSRIEKSYGKREALYNHGYQYMRDRLDELKCFLKLS